MGRFNNNHDLLEKDRLTSRQKEVALLVAQGFTNDQIAAKLYISPHVVAKHVGNIYKELDIHGMFGKRAALSRWVEKNL